MEDLFVRQSYRNFGIGKKIIEYLCNFCKENGCIRLDFHVLKWNPACDFYKQLGAINLSETRDWQLYRFTENGINALAALELD